MNRRFWLATVIVPALAQSPPLDSGAGKRSYSLHCAQCHGDDGDSLSYADILPLAGIRRRYPPEVIGSRSGAFSGRILAGKDLERLVEYLGVLRGSKGFPDSGWLISPYLLERKATHLTEFRVVDTRDRVAYSAGHITNAIPQEGSCRSTNEEITGWLGEIGVGPTTLVVIYDELGGPRAACLWWQIRQAGHQWVAVLDGGWGRWIAEKRFVDTAVPVIAPTRYSPRKFPARSPPTAAARTVLLGENGWNWTRMINTGGFRPFSELIRMAEEIGFRAGAGFRVDGPRDEYAHLVLTLHLLGYQVEESGESSIRLSTWRPNVLRD